MQKLITRIQNVLHRKYWELRIKLCRKGSLKKVIVFEIKPDFSDNTKAVFDEMVRRGLHKEYKMVWLVHDTQVPKKSTVPGVYHLLHWDMRAKYYNKIARIKICCNRFLEKDDERQICFYLSHGTGLKDIRHSYRVPAWVDYCIAAAPQLEEFHANALSFSREKTIGLGFPRNDILLHSQASIKELLGTTKADLAEAILEGICFEMKDIMAMNQELSGEVKHVRLCGGVSKSPMWCQMFADILNKPVELTEVSELGALGAAMCAGIGAGLFADCRDAVSKCVKITRIYTPDQSKVEEYEKAFSVWEHCYNISNEKIYI